TNTATVAGGGDVNPANNSAADVAIVFSHFIDVPADDPFLRWIEALALAGVTSGCGTALPMYCPDAPVTHAQMAVFLLRGLHGPAFVPPPATSAPFVDVTPDSPFAPWIEHLARGGITGGCATSPARFCPDAGVTRAQVAVFLLRAAHGAGHLPPLATGLFTDVPLDSPFAPFIEQLARDGITGGCGPTRFCPDQIVTREQMAVFLVRAFHLPM
ncbi:MAG: S-layer homology domain-containing protein, partial [bacterium]